MPKSCNSLDLQVINLVDVQRYEALFQKSAQVGINTIAGSFMSNFGKAKPDRAEVAGKLDLPA
jgi:hypothetical protein